MRKFIITVADYSVFVPILGQIGDVTKIEKQDEQLGWWRVELVVWHAPEGPDSDASIEVNRSRSDDGLNQTITYKIIPRKPAS